MQKTPRATPLDKAVTHAVENGEYYKDAMEWYNQKYLYPITERPVLIILGIVIMISLIIAASSFSNAFPQSVQIPFVIHANYGDDRFPQLNKLGNIENPQKMIAEYLITNYIRDRETYEAGQLETNARRQERILSQSTRREYRAYTSANDPVNPKSMIARFGNHTSRLFDEKSMRITFPQGKGRLTSALVYFTTTEKNRSKTKKIAWNVNISFRLTDIALVLSKHKKNLKLEVNSYALKPAS